MILNNIMNRNGLVFIVSYGIAKRIREIVSNKGEE